MHILFREGADSLALSSSCDLLYAFRDVCHLAINLQGHPQLQPAELLKDFKFLLAISLRQQEKKLRVFGPKMKRLGRK